MRSAKSKIGIGSGSLVLLGALATGSVAQNTTGRHIKAERLQETLAKLSEFGRNPDGGVTRWGFSEEDMAARRYVIGLMEDAGLKVRVDPAGNIFGRREGSDKLPAILFGSHIDSVLHGGNYDGDVGSLGAIEVMRSLKDRDVQTRHPLEAVIWTNEEGNHFGVGTLGSGIAAGDIGPEVLERKDDQTLTLADWLRKYGQDPAHLTDARIAKGSLAAYVELHIEQGPKLDAEKIPIGVVQGIVGLKRWQCVSSGMANHAGTTPMDRRRDALAASSRMVLAVREIVRSETGQQVGTVGYMKVEPGAINVIPGRTEFPVELRDLEMATVDRMWTKIQSAIEKIAAEERVGTQCKQIENVEPARSDLGIQKVIRQSAQALGLATLDLPSGAVQDAQEVARVAPMGMIFIPSRDGISHSPKEYSAPPDIANGAEVLYRTILELDAELNHY